MAVRIGTSGFIYEHWRGRFYPPSARGSELEHYASLFDTVELNVTFYRMPSAATFRSWAARVPEGFLFAVKASRYLTHIKRLREPEESVKFLVERAGELGSHLGPILLQLPPDMPADVPRLEEAMAAFPASIRLAVEPRHASWFTEELRVMLTERGAALCLADRRGPVTPTWRTADWTYLRFHGGRASPRPCYGERALETWSTRLSDDWGPHADAFAYFNNDHQGCALRDAASFGRLLARSGVDTGLLPAIDDDVLRIRKAPEKTQTPPVLSRRCNSARGSERRRSHENPASMTSPDWPFPPVRDQGDAMDDAQVTELLYQALETEIGGQAVYKAAIRCAQNPDLVEEWGKYLAETTTHEEILRETFARIDLDPEVETPGRAVVRYKGQSLVKAMEMALNEAGPSAAQLVAAESVVEAETKDHQNWELIGKVAENLDGEMAAALSEAYGKVEEEEDQHLYHTMGWARELWIESLGMPAVLPPPEEEKKVTTAIGAARAKQSREELLDA